MSWESILPIRPTTSDVEGPLVVVSSYTCHAELAHEPKGHEAPFSLYTYRLDIDNGTLTLLSVTQGPKNLAFSRFHQDKNVLYSCTESLMENGEVYSYSIDKKTGQLIELGHVDAGGTSTCYLTIDKSGKFMLLVNYWSSSVATMPISQETGILQQICSMYHPKGLDSKVQVQVGKRTAHSKNDPMAQRERQIDPHTHAIVLDPYLGCIAFVPDLGMDVIHELFFNRETGELFKIGDTPAGRTGMIHGPRYIEFHQALPVCYVINEISSEIAVFKVDRKRVEYIESKAGKLQEEGANMSLPATKTLQPLQCISTIPEAFDPSLNTCGRITCHPSGRYVIVSNRGHNSLAVFRIREKHGGCLALVGWTHTRGATPRHFQFDKSGQWLIVANQDSDTLAIFSFNLASGALTPGGVYAVPSPNFVACCTHDDE